MRSAADDFLQGVVQGDLGSTAGAVDEVLANSTLTRQDWDLDDRRYGGDAALVNTGFGGGYVTSEPELTSAEVWDPTQREWTTWDDCF